MKTRKIAYILSQFPSLSETFINDELLALKNRGYTISIFSLKTPNRESVHIALAKPLLDDAIYSAFLFSWPLILSNLRLFLKNPISYFSMLIKQLFQLISQPIELLKTLAIYPKSVYFASIVQNKGIHHIHAHFCTVPFSVAKFIGEINHIPYSVTAHGFDIHQYPPIDIKERIKAAQPFITISEYNKRHLISLTSQNLFDKIKIIHCGINLNKFPLRSYIIKPNKEKIQIIVVARLDPIKGLDILVEAFTQLKETHLNYDCRIIGDGPERSSLGKQIMENGISDRIHLLGALPHEEVIKHLYASDLFVLPSRSEGIPVSVMEAFAAGLPVIASDITGLPEIIDHEKNGLLVPPEDSAAFANAIRKLINNHEQLHAFSNNGREKIEKEFNIERSVDQLLKNWKF